MQLDHNDILKISATLASTFALYRIYQNYCRKYRFQLVGYVSEIVVFPVKGMRGVTAQEGRLTNLGMFINQENSWYMDRGFMVVNQETKTMVNAKQFPKLVSVFVDLKSNDTLEISASNFEKLVLKKPEKLETTDDVIVWRVNAKVFDCGDVAADWITNFLDSKTGQKFRIYYFDPEKSLQQVENFEKHN